MNVDNRPDSELTDAELADRYLKRNHDEAVRARYNVKNDDEVVEFANKLEEMAGQGKRIGTEDGRNFEALSPDEGSRLRVKSLRFGMMVQPVPLDEVPPDLRATIPEGQTIGRMLRLIRFGMENGEEQQVALESEQLVEIVRFGLFLAQNPDSIMDRMKQTAKDIMRENGGG